MIRYRSQKQLPLADFEWPFQVALDEQNRWVKLSQYRIPEQCDPKSHQETENLSHR